MIDPALRQFATERQAEVLDVVMQAGSNTKAADILGTDRRSVDGLMNRLKATAARRGYAPNNDMTHVTAEGYQISGTSTLFDKDGNQRLQWVKTSADAGKQAEIEQELLDAFLSEIKPEKPVKQDDGKCLEELANMFLITDYHMGMNAWPEETGAPWDLKIAEETLVAWFAEAIRLAPKAKTAIFAQLGDFLHWDGLDAVTPDHGFILEGDTRLQKMIRVAMRVLRRVVRMLLEKHGHVHLIMAEGNHDQAGSAWLREVFNVFYEDEPRITVDTSPQPYYCYEHGKTSLFFHHGHKRKITNIDTVFAAKFREVFGRTSHSYGHMGHLHNNKTVESNLMEVTQHRTLASPDSYATRGGWVSGRSAKVITYHKEYGFVGENCITPEMVKTT